MTGRVLLVDDEQHFLDGLRRTLRVEAPDLTLEFSNSVDQAIEAISARPPDAVVTDIRMPGKDGLELVAWIRRSNEASHIPTVVLTGSDEADLKQRALELGATDLLPKPCSPQDLCARLRSMLRIKQYEDELRGLNAELELRVAQRTADLEQARMEVVWRLAKAAEFRDDETGCHVMRVALFCRVVGLALGLDDGLVRLLAISSPLHDIGKIGIPDNILRKPGKLSDEERRVMEMHTVIGAEILKPTPCRNIRFMQQLEPHVVPTGQGKANEFLDMAARLALCHHEKWNGTGYPRGLSGEDIPVEARVLAVCDVWDALLSERPYKRAMTEGEALDVMRAEAGAHFDPEVFAAFEASLPELAAIRREFSNGVEDRLRDAA